jgi:predicted dehydrogenase
VIDLAEHITGDTIQRVSGWLRTFVDERPRPAEHSGLSGTAGSGRGPVTVDDAAVFLAELRGGALGVFEATRFANGRKNAIRIEVNGSRGSLAFDFEDMNLLHYFDGTEPAATAGFRRIVVTEPDHPYVAAWWPPGHGLGYEHAFTHQVVDLVNDIATGADPVPSFADGLRVQRVLAAVEASSQSGSWQEVPT